MFLKNIKINNFRSIQKASVDFENGMNILIGKNGVGKSNLLDFINKNVRSFLSNINRKNLRSPNLELEFTISEFDKDGNDIILTTYYRRDRILENGAMILHNIFRISKSKGGKILFNDKELIVKSSENISQDEWLEFRDDLSILFNLNKSYVRFDIPISSWLIASAKFEIFQDFTLTTDVWNNDFSYFFDIEKKLERRFFFIQSQFKAITDFDAEFIKECFEDVFNDAHIIRGLSNNTSIKDIRINPNINIYFIDGKWLIENLSIEFKIEKQWVSWGYLSDGTKRLFYLITECLSLDEGGILLIEEPELGIHPHQLFSLMNFLKEQSETKQIIISTHSPIVLDVLPPDELNRITIVKLGDKGTEFYKLNNAQIEKAKLYMSEEGDLSYYWLHSDLEDEE